MICKFCGSTIPDNSAFCNICGKKVEKEPVCKSCGAKLPLRSKFCNICGTAVSEDVPSITAPAPKPAPAPAPTVPDKQSFEYAGATYTFKKPNTKFTVFGVQLNSIYFAYGISGADKIYVHNTGIISDSLGDWEGGCQSAPKTKEEMLEMMRPRLDRLRAATFSQDFADPACFYSDGWVEGFKDGNHFRLEATIGKVMSMIYTNGYLLINTLVDLERKGNRREEWLGGDYGCEYVDWKPIFKLLIYKITPNGKLDQVNTCPNHVAVSAIAEDNGTITFMDQDYKKYSIDQQHAISLLRQPGYLPDKYGKIVWWTSKTNDSPEKIWLIDPKTGERSSKEIAY